MPLGAVRSVFVLVMFESLSLSLPHARYILSYWRLLLSYYLALRVALLRRNEMVSLGRPLSLHTEKQDLLNSTIKRVGEWNLEIRDPAYKVTG